MKNSAMRIICLFVLIHAYNSWSQVKYSMDVKSSVYNTERPIGCTENEVFTYTELKIHKDTEHKTYLLSKYPEGLEEVTRTKIKFKSKRSIWRAEIQNDTIVFLSTFRDFSNNSIHVFIDAFTCDDLEHCVERKITSFDCKTKSRWKQSLVKDHSGHKALALASSEFRSDKWNIQICYVNNSFIQIDKKSYDLNYSEEVLDFHEFEFLSDGKIYFSASENIYKDEGKKFGTSVKGHLFLIDSTSGIKEIKINISHEDMLGMAMFCNKESNYIILALKGIRDSENEYGLYTFEYDPKTDISKKVGFESLVGYMPQEPIFPASLHLPIEEYIHYKDVMGYSLRYRFQTLNSEDDEIIIFGESMARNFSLYKSPTARKGRWCTMYESMLAMKVNGKGELVWQLSIPRKNKLISMNQGTHANYYNFDLIQFDKSVLFTKKSNESLSSGILDLETGNYSSISFDPYRGHHWIPESDDSRPVMMGTDKIFSVRRAGRWSRIMKITFK